MNIVVVSGSARSNSQSIRVSAWVEAALEGRGHTVTTLDVSQLFVPEDASKLFNEDSPESRRFLPTKQILSEADAAVVISPEWHGMPPGKLIGFFQAIGASLAHTPTLLVTVSAAHHGGAYPSAVLRGHVSKNTRVLWLPDYVIIRSISQMLNDEPDEDDSYIQKRLLRTLDLLVVYAETLKPARQRIRNIMADYPNGM